MKFFLTPILIFAALFVHAQKHDFSGTWTGNQTQKAGGPWEHYEYEMQLTQKGKKVSGVSICTAGENSVTIKVEGYIKNGLLYFEETEFVTEPSISETLSWCRCKGVLKVMYKEDKAALIGSFQGWTVDGTECIGGAAYLQKKVNKA